MILTREVHLPVFRDNHGALVSAWCDFRQKRRSKGDADERLSVWLSHAVLIAGSLLGDERWRLAYFSGTLSNFPYRTNARILRAVPEDEVAALPHTAHDTYVRVFGGKPNLVHVVAMCEREVVDLHASVFREPEKGVHCDGVLWTINDPSREDHTGLPPVEEAQWEHFAVFAPRDERIPKRYHEAGPEAASCLERVIRDIFMLGQGVTPQTG